MGHFVVATLVKSVSCEEFCRQHCFGNPILLIYLGSYQYASMKIQAMLRVVEAGLYGLPVPLVISRLFILAAKLMSRVNDKHLVEVVAEAVCEPFGDEEELCMSMVKPRLETLVELANKLNEALEKGNESKARIIEEGLMKELASLLQYLTGTQVKLEINRVGSNASSQGS